MNCNDCQYRDIVRGSFDGDWVDICTKLNRIMYGEGIMRCSRYCQDDDYPYEILTPPPDCPLPNCEPSGNTG